MTEKLWACASEGWNAVSRNLPRIARIKWERGRECMHAGRLEEAEAELKEAMDEAPGHPLPRASLARVYLQQNRVREAKLLAEEILLDYPRHAYALTVLGDIHFREGRLEEALEVYSQAAQTDHGAYLVWRIARTLRAMKRYAEAIERIEERLAKQPEDPKLLVEMALCLQQTGRIDEAVAVYEKVRQLMPHNEFAREQLLRLRARGREPAAVVRELETMSRMSSQKDCPGVQAALAEKLKEAGRPREAARAYHEAWRLNPQRLFYLKQEGYCHHRAGDEEAALQCLLQAVREDPDDPAVRNTLEKIYSIKGSPEDFVALLEALHERYPQNGRLIGVLKKARKALEAGNAADEPT